MPNLNKALNQYTTAQSVAALMSELDTREGPKGGVVVHRRMTNLVKVFQHLRVYPTWDCNSEQMVLDCDNNHSLAPYDFEVRRILVEDFIRCDLGIACDAAYFERVCIAICRQNNRDRDAYLYVADPSEHELYNAEEFIVEE